MFDTKRIATLATAAHTDLGHVAARLAQAKASAASADQGQYLLHLNEARERLRTALDGIDCLRAVAATKF